MKESCDGGKQAGTLDPDPSRAVLGACYLFYQVDEFEVRLFHVSVERLSIFIGDPLVKVWEGRQWNPQNGWTDLRGYHQDTILQSLLMPWYLCIIVRR